MDGMNSHLCEVIKNLDRSPIDEGEEIEISLLLEGINLKYGFDFRHYVRSSIHRRILKLMKLNNLATITSVLERVIHDPDYMDTVLNIFSVKVTEMFRDPRFFETFRLKVIPILRSYPEIRIWHAGCATGEEAYSMAILIREEGLAEKTQIYATDFNEEAIEKAKLGAFPLKRMQLFTKNYLQAGGIKEFSEYYATDHKLAYFDSSLKGMITFARHNLVTDGSFNEFHVILCRNVLIYFDTSLKNKAHNLFYDSLIPNGFLGLGNKESLLSIEKEQYYKDVASAERIFQKG
jgi:chemotaxis protein methyltransferase CheR